MAEYILSAAAKTAPHTPQYQLDPQARLALLAGSESAKTALKIEHQYTAFAAKNNGCAFGQQSD